jgi:hypothetical protein
MSFSIVRFSPMNICVVLLSLLFLCAPLICMFQRSCSSREYATLLLLLLLSSIFPCFHYVCFVSFVVLLFVFYIPCWLCNWPPAVELST